MRAGSESHPYRTDLHPAHWLPGAALYAALIAVAALYWPGLSGPLLLDDFVNLEPLQILDQEDPDWRLLVVHQPSPLGRPVSMLSFIANWLTSGGAAWNFKHTNLMLHLLCGTLIFWMCGRLLDQPGSQTAHGGWWIALWVACAWLAAPLLVSTVLYAVQRMAQLAALFTLSGLLTYVIGRRQMDRHFARGIGVTLAGFAVFWPLAALSKENGALLPLLALVIELFVFQLQGTRRTRRFLLGLFVLTLGLPALAVALKLAADPGWLLSGYAWRDFTPYERLLTQARVLFDYIANILLLPGGRAMGIYHDDYAKSVSLGSPVTTLIAVASWLAIIVVALRYRRTRLGPVAAGLMFFLAAHALESSVFPLELYFEHRNYLPAVGVFLAVGVAADDLIPRLRYKKLLLAVLVLLPLGYATATYHRVLVWQSWEHILLAAERNNPDSLRVRAGLATLYMNRGQLGRALEQLEHAEALTLVRTGRSSSATALHRLLAYCAAGGNIADLEYARLGRISRFDDNPYTVNVLSRLTTLLERGGCPRIDTPRLAAALKDWRDAGPRSGQPHRLWSLDFLTARVLGLAGREREALEYLLAAADAFPERLGPGLMAVRYQLRLGDITTARDTLAALKRRDTGDIARHTNAIEAYRRALERR